MVSQQFDLRKISASEQSTLDAEIEKLTKKEAQSLL
jgi:hypothetical protein